MHSLRRLNRAQRIVIVIGLGVGLDIFGQWATTQGAGGLTGWTGYAPLNTSVFSPVSGMHPWVRLAIWLGLIIFWTVVSIVLLRSPSES